MLKRACGCVLASLSPSTYCAQVRLGPSLAAALPQDPFEHPLEQPLKWPSSCVLARSEAQPTARVRLVFSLCYGLDGNQFERLPTCYRNVSASFSRRSRPRHIAQVRLSLFLTRASLEPRLSGDKPQSPDRLENLILTRTIHECPLRRPILSPGGAFLVRPPRRTASTPASALRARNPGGLQSRTPRDGIHE